jgi:membrane-associated phospholipid phosphatase
MSIGHWKRRLQGTAALSRVEAVDRSCAQWAAGHRREPLDKLFVLGSHSGQVGIPYSALLVVLHYSSTNGKRIVVRRALAITVGTWLLAHLAKRADHRLRPCQVGDVAPLITCPKSSSMPSDEAACAFAAATYAARAIPQLRLRLFMAATFTAVSRVYVGAHYPSDVAAGALLGAVVGRAAGTV